MLTEPSLLRLKEFEKQDLLIYKYLLSSNVLLITTFCKLLLLEKPCKVLTEPLIVTLPSVSNAE